MALCFSILVSVTFHSSLLSLLLLGTSPGDVEGKEAISVDVITQDRFDVMVGNGSSRGGERPKVEATSDGDATSEAVPGPKPSATTDVETRRRESASVISAPRAYDDVTAGRIAPSTADAQRGGVQKGQVQGSRPGGEPARRNDPKVRPDADREAAVNDLPQVATSPGSDGGAARRVAMRGTVGDTRGPMPGTMRQAMMQLLRKQIEVCYVPPDLPAKDAALPLVLIRLKPDGALDGVPRSVRYAESPGAKALAAAALRAVRQCAPYRMPPRYAQYYDEWREIRAEFDLSGG